MSVAARSIASVLLASGLVVPAVAADMVRKAPAKQPISDQRCAKVEPLKGTPEVPGGDIFGFTSPTDIGDPCSWSWAIENTGRAGKRDGSYLAVSTKMQLGYTYSDSLAFAVSLFSIYNRWSNVSVAEAALADAGNGVFLNRINDLQFDGISGEILYRMIARSPGQPFAVTLGMEPRWARIDGLTGYEAEAFETEFKLFVDAALTSRLFAAMNITYGLGTSKYGIPNAVREKTSSTNVTLALTAQLHAAEKALLEGIFLGVEARHQASFTGLGLAERGGDALFAGPNLAISWQGGRMLNLAWTPQIAGRARQPSAPGSLDLDNYERHEFRVKYAAPLL